MVLVVTVAVRGMVLEVVAEELVVLELMVEQIMLAVMPPVEILLYKIRHRVSVQVVVEALVAMLTNREPQQNSVVAQAQVAVTAEIL